MKYGAKPLDMTINKSAIRKIAYPPNYMGGKHNLGFYVFEQLYDQLADPVAILKSRTQPDSLVVITEFLDAGNNPVVAAIHLNSKGEIDITNKIASVYGRRDFENFIGLNKIKKREMHKRDMKI